MNDTRNIILRAALRLFLQKSFKEVTMKDILEASGQAKGTFYYYFENKESIFEEASKYFFVNYIVVNCSRFTNGSLRFFLDSYLKQKEKSIQKMSELGDNFNLNIFMSQAYLRMKSLEVLMNMQKEKECDVWRAVLKTARADREINTVLTDEQIVSLFMHSYQGVRSGQLRSEQSNADALAEIKRDWDSLYQLLTVR